MSEPSNPYLAPGAILPPASAGKTYEPRLFAWSGRIGRLRYIAYLTAMSLLTSVLIGLGFALGLLQFNPAEMAEPFGFLKMGAFMVVLYVPILVGSFVLAKRRLNDANRSGWLSLLMIVPIVNLFISLYLFFAQGTEGENDYGLPPAPNTTLVKVGGLAFPLVILASMAFAVYAGLSGLEKQGTQQTGESSL